VLSVFDDQMFPYATPARAPIPDLRPDSRETPFVRLARERQAQYVLSGIYRGFGLDSGLDSGLGKKSLTQRKRHIEIEAFLHDGANGAVLARRRFQTELSGSVRSGSFSVNNLPTIGTLAFRQTPLGSAWTALIGDIARWAEREGSCLPFIARVMKTEGRLLQIDAGAESRMNPGDTLILHILREPPVFDLSPRLLGQEKQVRATVRLRAVYPAFSIAEVLEAQDGLQINPGDLIKKSYQKR
jgi:hypothetical protein